MHTQRTLLALAGALLLTAQAAPPADPVLAHYRAYRTAFAAHDLATADTEANAALEASVARDGQGGRTGVLALNLAQLRVAQGRNADAYAPAQQASDIAAHNSASGVDPLVARFTLGRAELTPEREDQGRALIIAALNDVGQRTDLHAEAYDAARALGSWSFLHVHFDDSITAWQAAQLYASSAQMDQADALAEALIGEGSARYTKAAIAQYRERQRTNDTHINFNAAPQFQRAEAAFVEAERTLRPYAYTPSTSEELTLAQALYSRAIAWRLLTRSYLFATGQPVPPEIAGPDNPESAMVTGPAASGATVSGPVVSGPVCTMHFVIEPRPNFPPGALADAQTQIGTVVMRFHLSETGEIIDKRVSAAIPPGSVFQASVEQAAQRWRVERDQSSPPNCHAPPLVFESVYFSIR